MQGRRKEQTLITVFGDDDLLNSQKVCDLSNGTSAHNQTITRRRCNPILNLIEEGIMAWGSKNEKIRIERERAERERKQKEREDVFATSTAGKQQQLNFLADKHQRYNVQDKTEQTSAMDKENLPKCESVEEKSGITVKGMVEQNFAKSNIQQSANINLVIKIEAKAQTKKDSHVSKPSTNISVVSVNENSNTNQTVSEENVNPPTQTASNSIEENVSGESQQALSVQKRTQKRRCRPLSCDTEAVFEPVSKNSKKN